MELLRKFESLIKKRTVVFNYDEEDGFFIQVLEQGRIYQNLITAELKPTHHKTIEGAITHAVEYLELEKDKYKTIKL